MHASTKSPFRPSAKINSGSGLLLQRKCACGGSAGASGECEACRNKNRLQAKLTVGASNDPLEQEADRVAEQVLAAPEQAAVGSAAPRIQRFTEAATDAGGDAAPSVEGVLAGGAGKPLDATLQADMEQRFGHDFSRVRVHADAAAAQSARDINAKAYTAGDHVVFGASQFMPATREGRRLVAHELAHVVQQGKGVARRIRRAPDGCKDSKRADTDAEVLAKVNAAAADPATLPTLYLGLKRARACFADFDETAFLTLVPATTKIYSDEMRKSIGKGYSKAIKGDDRKLAWAESIKPFAGYYLSGFDTANRLLTGANKRKLGGTLAPGHEPFTKFADKQNESKNRGKAQSAFSQSNVLVFSGHQYAQYKLPGVWNTGKWDVTLDVRGITGPLPEVKLVISTSCATLCKEAYELWKTIFPNAVFLGAARSTPLEGDVLANAFVNNLPQDMLFDPGAPGMSSAISAWKSAVKKTQSSAVRGGVLDIRQGKIEFWSGKAWVTMNATDPDNKCKVKDDYSTSVPDPRTP